MPAKNTVCKWKAASNDYTTTQASRCAEEHFAVRTV